MMSPRLLLTLMMLATLCFGIGYVGARATFARSECYPAGSMGSCVHVEQLYPTDCLTSECMSCQCTEPPQACCAFNQYFCMDDGHRFSTKDCFNPACKSNLEAGI